MNYFNGELLVGDLGGGSSRCVLVVSGWIGCCGKFDALLPSGTVL
jgi:exopolyphosphatase/pppGpp-phosphohydrolase